MTTRKKPPRSRQRVAGDDSSTFTFSGVVKWFVGVAGTLVGALFIFLAGWVWNTAGEVTKLTITVDGLEKRLAPLESMPLTVNTLQQQLTNAENVRSLGNLTLADRMNTLAKRMDDTEREARWRDRSGSGGGFQRR